MQGITAGPDGNLWFTESSGDRIGRITPTGAVTEPAGLSAGSFPQGITAGPDGNLWFTENGGSRIGRITTAGSAIEFTPGITASSGPYRITAGPDGNLWFTEASGNQVAKIGTGATFGTFSALTPARVLDTRNGTGLSGKFTAQQTRNLTVTGTGGLPASGVDAVLVNVTATNPAAAGWLTLFPAGSALPTASNLNFGAGQSVPNLVVVKVGHGGANEGAISITNTGGLPPVGGTVDVIADVMGWYANPGAPSPATRWSGLPPPGSSTPGTAPDSRVGPSPPKSTETSPWAGRRRARRRRLGGHERHRHQPERRGLADPVSHRRGPPHASNPNFAPGQSVANLVTVKLGFGITANSAPLGITQGPDGNLWFTENAGNRIGRITPTGTVTEFSTGISANSAPFGITAGPDGNLWFTEFSGSRIGRITPTGTVTEFSNGITAGSDPQGITAGPDGNLWFTENIGNQIGRITLTGTVTEFSIGITANSTLQGITKGPDGNLWFTESNGNRIGQITPTGTVTEFGITAGSGPIGITAGPDGNLWFTEIAGNRIGRITTSGTVTEFSNGITAGSGLQSIAAGPDGNLWFTEFSGNRIGRITTSGTVTEFSTGITANSGLRSIAAVPGGDLWFAENAGNRIARITTSGTVTERFSPGQVAITNTGGASVGGTVDVIGDVVAYYKAATGAALTTGPPQRILDTRSGLGGTTGPVARQATVTVDPHVALGTPPGAPTPG